MSDQKSHIAIYVPSLRGGGAERVMVTLANGFAARGHRVDLVLTRAEGPYLPEVAKEIRIVNLDKGRVLASLLPLACYLRRERPDAMLSALNHANVIAILARKLAWVRVRLVVSERNSLASRPEGLTGKVVRGMMRWLYPKADKVVCISKGIEKDMQRLVGVQATKTVTIYNPIDIEMVHRQMRAPLDHPWINAKIAPVILAVGRLTEQKDYPTLLKAFALLRKGREAQLIILGQGEKEARLKSLARDLGVAGEVFFAGFQDNPFAWMARCDVYVMSSAWEGFGNVLTEAMCAGASVVSTDCNSGPSEILENGRWGRLVPMGDAVALADAITETLNDQAPPDVAKRAQAFHSELAIDAYFAQLEVYREKDAT